MNAIQENKVSMYYKIRTFFASKLAMLTATMPALQGVVDNFISKLELLGDYEMISMEKNTGVTIQKNKYREQMRDITLTVAAGLRAYALVVDDDKLVRKVSLTKNKLDRERDAGILIICERVLNLATENASNIEVYGINADKLSEMEVIVDKFRDSYHQANDVREDAVAAGKKVDLCFSEIDHILLVIDAMMSTQAEDLPQLYYQYRFDRKIDDNASGRKSSEEKE